MSQEIVRELEGIFGEPLEQEKGHVGSAWNLHGVPVYYEVEKTEDDGKAYFKDYIKYDRDEGEICYICENDYKLYEGHIRDLIQSYKNGELNQEEFRDELDGHNDYVGVDHGYIRVYAANRQEEVANKLFRFFLEGDDPITTRDMMIEKGKLIEKGVKYYLLENKTLNETLYDLYKQEWIEEHVSEALSNQTKEQYLKYCEKENVNINYEEFLDEFGYQGELYASYHEFVHNELADKHVENYYLQKLYYKQEYREAKYLIVLDTVNFGKRCEQCKTLSDCVRKLVNYRDEYNIGSNSIEENFGNVYIGDTKAFKIMYNGRVRDMRYPEQGIFLDVENKVYYTLDDQLKPHVIPDIQYKPYGAEQIKNGAVMTKLENSELPGIGAEVVNDSGNKEYYFHENFKADIDGITVKEAYLKLLQNEFECVHGVTLDRNELENLYENVVLKSDEPNLINENDFHDCEDAFFSKEKDVSLEH